ncbi:alpha/beta hydrolase [Eupransor demetentiae]|uniref:Uncharacterized conserved protein with an alpha/beta hydrolase fold n=1 Tax=Eupransor demetentiae TaxID=3109584 RepID=A0ABP0ETM2_9LACO|nr:Uncharacterized conserved protein with an alpha/beta hydrolase fold [Lactobacillaceae bacterium LMG 33000]
MKFNKILLVFGATLLVVIACFSSIWITKQSHSGGKQIRNMRIAPVVFVPGSSASINRFDDLFTALNKGRRAKDKYSVLKVLVKKNNKLVYSGKVTDANHQPFIVVGFEDNSDSYANIKRQGKWLDIALTDLKKRYHFRQLSAVGHSNGGLDWTEYLENYYSSSDFSIDTLMTLGTPYNFSETSITKPTDMFRDFRDGATSLPSSLTVYSIAGSEDYTTDGLVPVQSVLAGKYIFQNHVKTYTQITVSGSNAQHSDLPDNTEVIQLIQEYVLGDNNSANHRRARNALKKEVEPKKDDDQKDNKDN